MDRRVAKSSILLPKEPTRRKSNRPARSAPGSARRTGHHIVAVLKETASGAKNDRVKRKKVMALAQARDIDAILVTELSRWGRSTQDLVQTLDVVTAATDC